MTELATRRIVAAMLGATIVVATLHATPAWSRPMRGARPVQSWQDLSPNDRQRALVESVVQLSQGLALDLVVEGVETEAEREALVDLGVERGQGYLFSRPVERDVAAMLLVAPGLATAGDRSS